MSNWISVKDRLPEECERVWAAIRGLNGDMKPWTTDVVYCSKLKRVGGAWEVPLVEMGKAEVYAWMPMEYPEPPRWGNLLEGEWIIDEMDSGEPSEGHYGWIEVRCPMCGTEFSLEEGQYGWGYGDPFPYLFCPMCGDDKREYHQRMKHNQEAYYRDLNEMADAIGRAHDEQES